MDRYIPSYISPDEDYWQTILEQGPVSVGPTPGGWEWKEPPPIADAIWDEARALQQTHTILELVIDDFNRGGVMARWKGVECFVPASHLLDYPFPADLTAREARFSQYVGQSLRLCIIEVEPHRSRILLSERQVSECEMVAPEWPGWLSAGRVCEGTVTSVRPFGAFVDIGPLEGMVHISEISWGRVRHPRDFLEPGQNVQVKILNVDHEHQRVGLSLKRLNSNPWSSVENRIKPGDVLLGEVVSVERFGVFLELLEGLEGLLHVSEIESPLTPARLYQVGQKVPVRILDIMPDEHRIALGLVDAGMIHAAA